MKNYQIFILAALLILAWSALTYKAIEDQKDQAVAGSTLPFASQTYNLAGSGVSSSATSFTLTSLTIKQTGQPIQDSDLGDTFYLTIEPGSNTKQEIVGCTTVGSNTGSTVTISGCTRGLSPITPYTASTTLQFTHAGGSQVIFSDPPQLFNLYYALANAATSTNVLIFSSTTPPRLDFTAAQKSGTYIATTSEFASIDYVNAVALVSAPNASAGAKGVLQLPTARQAASSTLLGSTGASMALQTALATDTPTTQGCSLTGALSGGCVAMTALDGYLRQTWLDLTKPFTVTGQWTFTGLFATNASTTNATTTSLGLPSITSTLLKTSSTGVVQPAVSGTDYQKQQYTAASTNDFTVNNTTSTTTMMTIPASTLTASSSITLTSILGITGAQTCTVRLRDGTGATLTNVVVISAADSVAQIQLDVYSQTSLTSQIGRGMQVGKEIQASASETTSTVNFANALVLNLVMTSSAASNCNINNWFITVTP